MRWGQLWKVKPPFGLLFQTIICPILLSCNMLLWTTPQSLERWYSWCTVNAPCKLSYWIDICLLQCFDMVVWTVLCPQIHGFMSFLVSECCFGHYILSLWSYHFVTMVLQFCHFGCINCHLFGHNALSNWSSNSWSNCVFAIVKDHHICHEIPSLWSWLNVTLDRAYTTRKIRGKMGFTSVKEM